MNEIIIGNQIWADSNLNVVNFSNGDIIFQASSTEEWKLALKNKQPAWCYYNYDENQGIKYGKLYNWYAVNDSRCIAPKGWRIPSSEDFVSLVNLVKIEKLYTLKSKDLWNYECLFEEREIDRIDLDVHQNGGKGSDILGFNGIPSGRCNDKGIFTDLNHFTFFWSKTELIFNSLNNIYQFDQESDIIPISTVKNDEKENLVFIFSLQCFTEYNEIRDQSVEETTFNAANKTNGFSIRCIKKDSNISEKESFISAVKINNDLYRTLPDKYKNDRDLVIELIKNNGRFLEYVPTYFKDDKEIVLLAVNNNGLSLRYASKNLKNDREVVIEAVKKSYLALRFSNEHFYDDLEIISTAVNLSGKALAFASERLRNKYEIVTNALKTSGEVLEYVNIELRRDRKIVIEAVKKYGLALKYASKDLQNDREIVFTAVKKDGFALEYASDELKNDLIIVQAATSFSISSLKFVSEKLKKNREIVLKYIQKNGESLEFAPVEFQNDREIVFQAIYYSGLGDLIQFASDSLKNDLLIAYIATKYSKTAHNFINYCIKNELTKFEDKYGQMIHLNYFLFD